MRVNRSEIFGYYVLLVVGSLLPSIVLSQDPTLLPVNYTHDGDELQGFMTLPSEEGTFPAVVIIPDWDGVNDYEKMRAQMIASEFGYVGFAADIYGKDLHEVPDRAQRAELANLYRNNATLFASRIQSAVETVQAMDQVDSSKIALIGYCFGGTGVLTYAMTGTNGEGVQAIVSFHGGLSQVPGAMDNIAVAPKVLVLSGGSDDTSTAIMDLEIEMDAVNATWEITRYSNIQHAFTVFGDDRYNEWADMRSWSTTKEFLMEAFGELTYESSPPSELAITAVDYNDTDGTQLRGYLAKPETMSSTDLLPAIVIIPDWDGNNQYEQERATLLAELGYIGFAADIYGSDLQDGLSIQQRIELVGAYRGNPDLFVQRMVRAIEEVKKVEGVDPTNIAVIGYCFGGSGIIELAFSGNTDVKLVVSYHGGLQELPEPDVSITPYVLVLSGGIDEAHGNQTILEGALDGGQADWEITRYSGVDHGFTSWESPAYSLRADYRSWQSMLTSMKELMPLEISDPTTGGEDTTTEGGDGTEGTGRKEVSSARDMQVLFAMVASFIAFFL